MAGAVPKSRPVPIEPPTATIVIWPALSWWRRPDSETEAGEDMDRLLYQKPGESSREN